MIVASCHPPLPPLFLQLRSLSLRIAVSTILVSIYSVELYASSIGFAEVGGESDAHGHALCLSRGGEREGRTCHAVVAERARSMDPRGAAAVAGERPRLWAASSAMVTEGPSRLLTCSCVQHGGFITYCLPTVCITRETSSLQTMGEDVQAGPRWGDVAGLIAI